jgi:hypothetical protein
MSNYIREIKVSRYEPYPADEPNSWAVGFTVILTNGRSFYVDTAVPFSEFQEQDTATDEDVVAKAYEKLKDSINSQAEALGKKAPVLGKTFTPPTQSTQ